MTQVQKKKTPLLENLDFNATYDVLKDSNKLSTINMSTGTRLWNDKFNVQFGAIFDPYAMDSKGNKIRYYDLEKNGQLARLTSANMSISTSFTSTDSKSKNTTNTNQPQNQQQQPNPNLNPSNRNNPDVNFDIPWSIRIGYNWGYSKPGLTKSIINSTTFSGDMSITKKWKMTMQSGYDFTNKQFNPTSFNLNRDLHCWIMTFSWIPFGSRKSYEFTIRVKASILQDLKYTKKTDFRDNL